MHKYGKYIVAHAIRAANSWEKNHNLLLGSPQFTGYIIALRVKFYQVINWASLCTVLALALLAKGDCTSLECEDDQF